MAVSTMVGTAKNKTKTKNKRTMQFGIFVFVKVQETNWRAICKVVNVMGVLYFYENFFVLRKSSFPS